MMKFTRRIFAIAVATTSLILMTGIAAAQAKKPIKIAFGDIASVETLNLLIAIERTKERGVPIDVTFFESEEEAAQAVVEGQADIGVGTPYAQIQKSTAPMRMFFKARERGDVDATDEALYANTDFLNARSDDVTALVEELLQTWREINAKPAVVANLREKFGLLKDLPADREKEIVPYYEDSVAAGIFPNSGGKPEQIKADFEFYSTDGQLEGDAESLKVEEFWDFKALKNALSNLEN